MQFRCEKCMKVFSDETKICPFCGHVNAQPDEESLFLRPGTQIRDRYIIGAVLGYGGFGATYVAWDEMLERKVAIKEYFPSALSTRKPSQTALSIFSGDKGEFFRIGLKKYLSEARTMAKLESIPNIVGVREYFEENNTAYIVMEFVEGITMKEHLKQNGTLSSKDAVNMFLPLIKSLSQVHEYNVIHRDISPDNIMISKKGIKLIDFGAAREVYDDKEKSLSIVLKHGYAPEEQYHKKGNQGPWTDVYALCATLYKCITGKTPPQVFDRMAGDSIEPISQMGISIAPHIEKAIFKGLNIEVCDRFQSMDELYNALSTVETDENVVKPKKNITVAPVQIIGSDSHTGAPAVTMPEDISGVSAVTGSENVQSEVKTKSGKTNKDNSMIIIGIIAAILIVATVVTAIVLFGRSGRDSESTTLPPTGEQTAAVVGTDAPSTEEASTADATSDTAEEESSTSESTSSTTTTTKKIVAPNKSKNTYSWLYGSDSTSVVGVKLVIWGTYEKFDSTAEIYCNIDTHMCQNEYSSFMGKTQNSSRTDEYYFTFNLKDETCEYSTSFTSYIDGESCDGIEGEDQIVEADIEYEYNDDCVEVYLYFPESVEYYGCECGGKETLYINIWITENAFITPDGKGNADWEYLKSYY